MRNGRRSLWAVVFTLCALALPASAQAAPTWQLTPDPAPGGVADIFAGGGPRVSLAVVQQRPFLATVSQSGDLTVHTLNAAGSGWQQIGGALNSRRVVGDPAMASSSRTPWVAWREQTATGTYRIHVARLRGGRFRQILGGLGRTESDLQFIPFDLAVYGGRPYVAYQGAGGRLRVVRLDAGDNQFRSANAGLRPGALGTTVRLATAGRGLYLAYNLGDSAPMSTVISRLTSDRRGWRTVVSETESPGYLPLTDAVGGGGRLYLSIGPVVKRLTADGRLVRVGDAPLGLSFVQSLGYANGVLHAFLETAPAPDVNIPHMFAFVGGSWQAETQPPWQGDAPPPQIDGDTGGTQFVRSGNVLWLVWHWAEGDFASPRTVHVAHLP